MILTLRGSSPSTLACKLRLFLVCLQPLSASPFKLVLLNGWGLEFFKASLSVWSLTSQTGVETPDLVPRAKLSLLPRCWSHSIASPLELGPCHNSTVPPRTSSSLETLHKGLLTVWVSTEASWKWLVHLWSTRGSGYALFFIVFLSFQTFRREPGQDLRHKKRMLVSKPQQRGRWTTHPLCGYGALATILALAA